MKKIFFNRIWLLILGIVLAGSILSYGSAAYNKTINLPADKHDNIQKLADKQIGSDTVIKPKDEEIKKLDTNKQTTKTKNDIVDDSNNQQSQPTNTPTSNNTITQTASQNIEQYVTVKIENVGEYKVNYQTGDNGWKIMQRAAKENNFAMTYQVYDFGIYVISLGNIEPKNNSYWSLYYNGNYSMVGIRDIIMKPNDTIMWKVEQW